MSQPFQDILLHISAVDGDKIKNRLVQLTNKQPSVVIGRASRNVTKGLRPATDNAFFDSPVMSRSHAVVKTDGNGRVCAKDTNSMHGTYCDGQKLEHDEELLLYDGVQLTFGSEVFRGVDSFPPKTLVFNIENKAKNIPSKDTFTDAKHKMGYGLINSELLLSGDEADSDHENDNREDTGSPFDVRSISEGLEDDISEIVKEDFPERKHAVMTINDMLTSEHRKSCDTIEIEDDDEPVSQMGSMAEPILIEDHDVKKHSTVRTGYGIHDSTFDDEFEEDDELAALDQPAQIFSLPTSSLFTTHEGEPVKNDVPMSSANLPSINVPPRFNTDFELPRIASSSLVNIQDIVSRSKLALEEFRKASALRQRAQDFWRSRLEFGKQGPVSQTVAPQAKIAEDCVVEKEIIESVMEKEVVENQYMPNTEYDEDSDAISISSSLFETEKKKAYSPLITSPITPEPIKHHREFYNHSPLGDDTESEMNDEDEDNSVFASDGEEDVDNDIQDVDIPVTESAGEKPQDVMEEIHEPPETAFFQLGSAVPAMSIQDLPSPIDIAVAHHSVGWAVPSTTQPEALEDLIENIESKLSTEVNVQQPASDSSRCLSSSRSSRKRSYEEFVADLHEKECQGGQEQHHEETLPDAQRRDLYTTSLPSSVDPCSKEIITARSTQEGQPTNKRLKVQEGNNRSWVKNVASVAVPTIVGALLGGVGMFAALVATAEME